MLALSVRQPFAELILRGVKTVEYRSRPTRVGGRRFFIYASKGTAKKAVWSRDLAVPGEAPPAWMVELAEQVEMIEPGALAPFTPSGLNCLLCGFLCASAALRSYSLSHVKN